MNLHKRIVLFSLVLLAVTFTACSQVGSVDVAQVSGTVTMDGKPLPKAIVTFAPSEEGTEMPPSVGATDSEGRFTLRTATGQVGAIPGTHNVLITNEGAEAGVELPDDRSLWKKPENPVPDKYRDPLNPAITFNVPPKGTEAANFELQSK
jgi:hypothetical protein